MSIETNIESIKERLAEGVKLVAVSKFHPLEAILEAYQCGQRAFGENRPQELAAKAVQLPQDIEWHFLGHLQTNKLKMVLPYASLVQSVDTLHLLQAIDEWGGNNGKDIDVLLELHIGAEETKQGFVEEEILDLLFTVANSLKPDGTHSKYPNINFRGLMGMATNTDDQDVVRADFRRISALFRALREDYPSLEAFDQLSIGMSGDWRLAVAEGSTIVRIGTSIFGEREY